MSEAERAASSAGQREQHQQGSSHAGRRPQFPAKPWRVTEVGLDQATLAVSESLFTLSNGHIGVLLAITPVAGLGRVISAVPGLTNRTRV